MPRNKPYTQSHFSVNLTGAGIEKMYFTTYSGTSITVDTSVYVDGLNHRKSTITGMSKYEDVTLTVPYSPELHDAGYAAILEASEAGTELTVGVTPVSSLKDMTPVGKSDTLNGCLVVSCNKYAVDRGSADASMLEVVLSVDNVT